ncbi:hypothetical protein BTUL_0219g00160 [Botrytis tulipae]|uniref:Uncharacterized protein n=1 Tax=Botrytis tulipae TaxID=87230 RepID=A0A4Z1EGA2_9HELO|nr:hypothetical protein BTUL_0219g00160 [Botrytis tulipae]
MAGSSFKNKRHVKSLGPQLPSGGKASSLDNLHHHLSPATELSTDFASTEHVAWSTLMLSPRQQQEQMMTGTNGAKQELDVLSIDFLVK